MLEPVAAVADHRRVVALPDQRRQPQPEQRERQAGGDLVGQQKLGEHAEDRREDHAAGHADDAGQDARGQHRQQDRTGKPVPVRDAGAGTKWTRPR